MLMKKKIINIKRISVLLVYLCLIPCFSRAESSIVNLIDHPNAEYAFREGATILEVVFPRVHSSDCAVLRFGDDVMMIDA